jgi:hypothetical protein
MLGGILGNPAGALPGVEAIRVAWLFCLRSATVILTAAGAAALALFALLKKQSPGELVRDLKSRRVLWLWLTQSGKLLMGALAYNAFVLLAVQPILRKWFPPLKPWEHLQGVFAGSTRTTYEDIVPAVATALWIAGNALVITLLNRRLQVARDVE